MTRRNERPRLTYKVNLPGGQDRLREMILYVSSKCASAPRFGKLKLNKILWKADFDAFAKRGVPVTGRSYQRLENGPAPIEMPPVLAELVDAGELRFDITTFGGGMAEERPLATRPARLSKFFSEDDLAFVDAAIEYFWDMSATASSDASHGLAWKTRGDLTAMPYEAAYLSDEEATDELKVAMKRYAEEAGLRSY
jgi:hypothetical protein